MKFKVKIKETNKFNSNNRHTIDIVCNNKFHDVIQNILCEKSEISTCQIRAQDQPFCIWKYLEDACHFNSQRNFEVLWKNDIMSNDRAVSQREKILRWFQLITPLMYEKVLEVAPLKANKQVRLEMASCSIESLVFLKWIWQVRQIYQIFGLLFLKFKRLKLKIKF